MIFAFVFSLYLHLIMQQQKTSPFGTKPPSFGAKPSPSDNATAKPSPSDNGGKNTPEGEPSKPIKSQRLNAESSPKKPTQMSVARESSGSNSSYTQAYRIEQTDPKETEEFCQKMMKEIDDEFNDFIDSTIYFDEMTDALKKTINCLDLIYENYQYTDLSKDYRESYKIYEEYRRSEGKKGRTKQFRRR